MGENPSLDSKIRVAEDKANELLPKVTQLVETYQTKLTQAKKELADSEAKRRAFLKAAEVTQAPLARPTENPAPADAGSGVFCEEN